MDIETMPTAQIRAEIDDRDARIAELEGIINRVAMQVGHPPIAPGEGALDAIAEAVERQIAYAREREETLDSITPEHLQAFAASEAHHGEHHVREAELEARAEAALTELANTRFVMDKRGDEVDLLRGLLTEAEADAARNLGRAMMAEAELNAAMANCKTYRVALEDILKELHDGVTPLLHRGKPGAFDICTQRIARARKALRPDEQPAAAICTTCGGTGQIILSAFPTAQGEHTPAICIECGGSGRK